RTLRRMSLINDALRRASQQQTPVPTARETQAGLQPAESESTATRAPLLVGLPLALALLVAGWWCIHHARTDGTPAPSVGLVGQPSQPPTSDPASRTPESLTRSSDETQASSPVNRAQPAPSVSEQSNVASAAAPQSNVLAAATVTPSSESRTD